MVCGHRGPFRRVAPRDGPAGLARVVRRNQRQSIAGLCRPDSPVRADAAARRSHRNSVPEDPVTPPRRVVVDGEGRPLLPPPVVVSRPSGGSGPGPDHPPSRSGPGSSRGLPPRNASRPSGGASPRLVGRSATRRRSAAAARRARRRARPGAGAAPASRRRTPPRAAGAGRRSPLFGQKAIARSACAVIVSDGLTPRLAEIAEPSTTCRPSWPYTRWYGSMTPVRGESPMAQPPMKCAVSGRLNGSPIEPPARAADGLGHAPDGLVAPPGSRRVGCAVALP